MSVPRTVLAATAAWLAVVAVGSALVWSVISRAGDVEPGSGSTVPAATASGPGSPSSSAGPSARPSDGPTSGPATGPTGAPTTGVERRTWQGAGGYVVVQCRGAVISLVSAQADVGFVVEVDRRGPEQVRVVFDGQGEEGRESAVSADCRAGVPVLAASTDG